MNFKPLYDRVLVQRVEEASVSAGGIIIPDSAKEKPLRGKVLAVGAGKLLDDGNLRPLDVKAGDVVLFGKYAGTEIKIDGKEHQIMRESEILAVLEDLQGQLRSDA